MKDSTATQTGGIKEMLVTTFEQLTLEEILMHILVIFLIFASARILELLINRIFIQRLFYMRAIDRGREFAIKQIVRYVIYVMAISVMLEHLKIGSAFFTSFAALFVGIGLGLQQTFSDLICGLVLLIEGTVKVDDIVEVDGIMGRVTSIGIRTSTVQTRDAISLIVPNSKMVSDKVINWSDNDEATRFKVEVGVAYESSAELVSQCLVEAAREASIDVLEKPEPPTVLLKNFGDSALIFEIYFWSKNNWDQDIIKSRIRFKIFEIFQRNNIIIAFPQRDITLKMDSDKNFEQYIKKQNQQIQTTKQKNI
ncbi:MAG: potassium transporter KefA [Cytophagales bacterium]|nr:MAG: potassium transporter KefA [Cytophagales bacterium]